MPTGQVVIDVKLTGVDEMREHAVELFAAHHAEMEPHYTDFEVNWARYYEAEERHALLALAAWDTTRNEVVGYSIGFIVEHFHYNLYVYQHDALYVAKGYRRGRLGVELLKLTKKEAEEQGAQRLLWHAKPDTKLDKLLRHLGYRHEENLYSMEV